MNQLNAFVHIIESPNDIDILEGTKQGLALGESLGLAKIPYCYNFVTTKQSFEIALDQRLIQARKHYPAHFPILHFTMHGNQKGIQLTNETFITWLELYNYLMPIKQQIKQQYDRPLLICMSSCYGSFALQMALSESNSPYLFLIGNNESVSWSDATVAYITFYHLLFKKNNHTIYDCVERMKLASDNNDFELWDGEKIRNIYIEYNKQQQ
ncbi:MAG TPA: hypothetical protein V6C58_02800 [Allocoleopsis sp.]